MILTELNEKILGTCSKEVKYESPTVQEVKLFGELLYSGDKINAIYESTNDAKCFFKAFPDIRKIFGSDKAIDIFYANKCGKLFNGVPMRAVYILKDTLAMENKKFINLAISRCGNHLGSYVDKMYVSEYGSFTLLDIMENICGRKVNLITDSVRKAKNFDVYEIYVPNTKRVALLPIDIGDALSYEDLENVVFNPNRGLCINNIPLRTLNGRIGVVTNDYDLREAF